jgi:hypothetical protein
MKNFGGKFDIAIYAITLSQVAVVGLVEVTITWLKILLKSRRKEEAYKF